MKLLFVEDDPAQRLMFGTALQRAGATVKVLSQYDALAVDWRNFDAILCDVMMADNDGPSLIHNAINLYAPLPPVFLFSAIADELLSGEAQSMGHGVQWISKSIPIGSLLGEIRKRCAS